MKTANTDYDSDSDALINLHNPTNPIISMTPANKYRDHPALLIIDMVKDNFKDRRQLPITSSARKIINPTNRIIQQFRLE